MNLNFAKPDNKRQKVVAVLLVIVAIILIWQLYDLFVGDKPAQKVVAPAAESVVAKQLPHEQSMAVTPAATATQLAQNATSTGGDTSAAVNPADANQTEYLRLVTEYQMAQLQRMIAEDNEAIAIAKQNAAKAMSETSKLMGGSGGLTTVSSSNQTNSNDYQLVYTGQQSDNSWSATVKKNGQSFDVIVGGKLPDGSQVLSIDDNGVLLQQGNIKKLVTFSGVTETTANNTSTVAPMPVAKAIEKKEQAEKTEAALTATPDNPTAPEKKTREAIVKPQAVLPQKPAENKPVDKKEQVEKAEKTAKAENTLVATLDNLTTSDKKTPVTKVEQPKIQPVAVEAKSNAAKPAAVKTADLQIPDSSKADSSLLPLQQPMVVFPHHGKADTTAKAVAPVATAAPAVDLADNAILAVNSNYYTIQLTGDHKLEDLQQFINKHNLQNKASYFRTYDMQNRELYILIYGQYTTSAEAKAALKQLPENVKAEGAFVVKYATIQTVLKKPAPAVNKQ